MPGSPRIIPVADAIDMDVGAPEPAIIATEDELLLSYTADDGMICVVTFKSPCAHYSGSPNDEALAGHPLYSVGLQHYAFAEVLNSAWIAELRDRNRVHPNHSDSLFNGLRHFILTFHDSTVEVIAKGYTISRSNETLLTTANRLTRRS